MESVKKEKKFCSHLCPQMQGMFFPHSSEWQLFTALERVESWLSQRPPGWKLNLFPGNPSLLTAWLQYEVCFLECHSGV